MPVAGGPHHGEVLEIGESGSYVLTTRPADGGKLYGVIVNQTVLPVRRYGIIIGGEGRRAVSVLVHPEAEHSTAVVCDAIQRAMASGWMIGEGEP